MNSTDLKLRAFFKNDFFQIDMTEKIESKIVKMTAFSLQMMTSFERKKFYFEVVDTVSEYF